MKKEDTYVQCPYYKKDGERPDRCQWQMQGGERVAAIGERGRRAVADEGAEYRNRSADKELRRVKF